MTVANDHPVAYAATSVSDGIIGIIIKVKAGAQKFVGSSGGNAGEKFINLISVDFNQFWTKWINLIRISVDFNFGQNGSI